jgi:predicted RNA-binding Zn-ribbon protein involved in translation (DUF1610 family)
MKLRRTLNSCACEKAKGKVWSKRWKTADRKCGHDDNYGHSGKYDKNENFILTCSCGVESDPQKIGEQVKFSCPECKKTTQWNWSNSEARDEWNKINKNS